MKKRCERFIMTFIISIFVYSILGLLYTQAVPQSSHINDQSFTDNTTNKENSTKTEEEIDTKNAKNIKELNKTAVTVEKKDNQVMKTKTDANIENKHTIKIRPSILNELYQIITTPMVKFYKNVRVRFVMKNIGVCMVNGVMELVTYFLPAPMIPLVTSLAGMMIPFEPVIMLREKIPVTSYRRALNSAVDSFLGTFDNFKKNNEFDFEDDPYMAKKFNRRFGKD